MSKKPEPRTSTSTTKLEELRQSRKIASTPDSVLLYGPRVVDYEASTRPAVVDPTAMFVSSHIPWTVEWVGTVVNHKTMRPYFVYVARRARRYAQLIGNIAVPS